MIRRPTEDGWLLITQHDHALAAGGLARHLGGAVFSPPTRYIETVEAIANHDCGWPLQDDFPTTNPQGYPLHVFEAEADLAVTVWSASVARCMELGDWQGMLASLHALNLSALHASHSQEMSRASQFALNKFQHQQIEIQEQLRPRLDLSNELPRKLGLAARGASDRDDELLFNFRLLTFMDRLSLSLCCGKPLFAKMEDVLTKVGSRPIIVSTRMSDASTLAIRPWPFELERIELHVPTRRVQQEPFESPLAFLEAYRAAAVEMLTLVVKPA